MGSLLSSKGLGASYDLVLSAETIYSLHGANRLLECIKQVRSREARAYRGGLQGGVSGGDVHMRSYERGAGLVAEWTAP